jgi:NADH-quinone oxidoreductase subunit E
MKTQAPLSVEAVVQRYGAQAGYLVPVLQDLQHEYGYLPVPELKAVARQLRVPLARVYGVATFYRSFSLKPRGRHLISVCTGTVCHLKGAGQLVTAIREGLRLGTGETSADRRFTLETVNCVGACALAPVLVVDSTYYAKVRPSQVGKILEPYR